MNNKDFIAELAQRTGYSADEAQNFVNTVVDAMGDCLQDDNSVVIPNFGTFEVKKKLERVVVNPGTKQRMLVPPKLVVNYKPAATLKDKANSK